MSEFHPITILFDEYIQRLTDEAGVIPTDQTKKWIRDAMAVSFIFAIAYSKTDPSKSETERVDQAAEIIVAIKEIQEKLGD